MAEMNFFELVKNIFNYTLFTLNQTAITIGSIIIFLFILVVFLVGAKLFTRMLSTRVLKRMQIDKAIRYNLERVIYYLLVVIGAIVAFQFIGINLSGLAVLLGFLSVGIGFGLQNVTSNFVAGLILLFERPIKIGDRVTVGDTLGDVIAIGMRSTTIRSVNNISIIVPNSEFISERVINWSYGDRKVRLDIDVGVSYNSDLETVLRCLDEIARENKHVLEKPESAVQFMEFGDSSWNMQLRCWIPNPKIQPKVQHELNCAIVQKFRENNVEIPYPQRDLHVRSPIPVPFSASR
jgi:small-conductance mechanosensitive channel